VAPEQIVTNFGLAPFDRIAKPNRLAVFSSDENVNRSDRNFRRGMKPSGIFRRRNRPS
jgi:hypothetical protein